MRNIRSQTHAPARASSARDMRLLRFWKECPVTLTEYQLDKTAQHREKHFEIKDGEGQLLGVCFLTDIDQENRRCRVGMKTVSTPDSNRAMQESVIRMLVDLAFNDLSLHRIEADVYSDEDSWREALERTEFCLEGHLRDHVLIGGRYFDIERYAIVRNNPPNLTAAA